MFDRLLDILAERKDQAGLSGQVLINGSPPPPNFKRISGYVVQVLESYDVVLHNFCSCFSVALLTYDSGLILSG